MKIVLDTNVLVAGLLQPFGSPGTIVRMIPSGVLKLCYDARILDEYREVLLRPKFRFERSEVKALLEEIEDCGLLAASKPLPEPLPDSDDEMFLQAALAAEAECLITGNAKHYPRNRCCGMIVVSPAEFLKVFRKRIVS